MIRPIKWQDNVVSLLDQTLLPNEQVWVECPTYQEVGEGIRTMKVRGAPAIGVAAAMGMALAAIHSKADHFSALQQELKTAGLFLSETRPTAINLFWAIEKMESKLASLSEKSLEEIKTIMVDEALKIQDEDIQMCQAIGDHGATLIQENSTILTHCNAGALATAAYGTALGVIRSAHKDQKNIHVYVDETRPFLQGSRLTAWELMEEGIPMTLITDNMAGHFIKEGKIQAIVVGADRICANGDTANKIGTYTLSVLAKEHHIPFYVAAPYSTFDFSLANGNHIPIEERDSQEVIQIKDHLLAPEGVNVANPAFDVTPNENITAIITEKGVIHAPFLELKSLVIK